MKRMSSRTGGKHRPSRSSEATEDLILTLPPEIIVDILLRLPVESLLRCMSVCKAWLSVISDPKFVKSHLNLSVKCDDYQHRLIYHSLSKSSLKSCYLSNLLYDKSVEVELDYPLKRPCKFVHIVGSCNGLICVSNEEGILYIWNPVTRRSDRLPHHGVKVRPGWLISYGFGYLESNDDYKVVGIVFKIKNGGSGYSSEVKVYSLKTGNWKRIGEFPNGFAMSASGKYLNGALHWVASHGFGSPRIVSLDLAKEIYDEVPQPIYEKNGLSLTLGLGVLGDSLSVMCNHYEGHWDVWVMKEYGVKESWTKLDSIPYLTRGQFLVPMYISNDGKLLKSGLKLFLCDPKNKHISEIQNMDNCLDAHTYVESLIAPVAPTRRDDNYKMITRNEGHKGRICPGQKPRKRRE